MEYGIIEKLMNMYSPKSPRCLASIKQTREQQQRTNKKGAPSSFTLKNFAGVFVALLVGYGLSILTFIGELLIGRYFKK